MINQNVSKRKIMGNQYVAVSGALEPSYVYRASNVEEDTTYINIQMKEIGMR